MRLPIHVINMLQKVTCNDLCHMSNCERLLADIVAKTGEPMDITTLKRLLGFEVDKQLPDIASLNHIANYLSYDSWEVLVENELAICADLDKPIKRLRSADLFVGDEVEITYMPDRKVAFRYLGNDWFEVVKRENNKLQVGDHVRILLLEKGTAYYAYEVIRDNENLGNYTAAISMGGVLSLHVKRVGYGSHLESAYFHEGKIF